MDPLTPPQSAALEFIKKFLMQHGMPPTRAELAEGLGYESRNTADFHIKALVRKGYLDALVGARGIKLTEELGVPLIGRVAAGAPILADQNIVGHYQIDPDLFKGRPDYLLEVRGDSMIDAGIFNGDWVGVHKTAVARSGQIAVVRLDDEVTIKTLRLKGSRAELHPANRAYRPILIDLSRRAFAIEGTLVGLIRRYK